MHRIERLQEEIQHLVSATILFDLSDPRIKSVALTRVVVTKDIGIARIYFDMTGAKEERAKAEAALMKARGFIRKKLAATLQIKQVPELEFHYDQTKDEVSRVEALFSKI